MSSRNRMQDRRDSRAFTLVELIIVVLVLGILGTVAVSRATYSYEDSIKVALQSNLDAMYDAIEMNRTGPYPATIDPDWFYSGKLPKHPQAESAWTYVQVATDASVTDPTNKVLEGLYAPYWYNSATGEVRCRVGHVGSEAETLAFYNEVNGTQATSLGNYNGSSKSSGGSGGGSK